MRVRMNYNTRQPSPVTRHALAAAACAALLAAGTCAAQAAQQAVFPD